MTEPKSFVVRHSGMARGVGTDRVCTEYRGEGCEIYIPGRLTAHAFRVTIEPVPSKRERKLDVLRDFDSMHTTLTPEAALEALEAIDQEDL